MIFARLGKDIPNEWRHDPEIQNIYGDTVAICYARCG